MSFGHVAELKRELEESGYSFVKREEDGHWEFRDNDLLIAQGRSIGDIIRSQSKELGVW